MDTPSPPPRSFRPTSTTPGVWLRPARNEDYDFLYNLHRLALGTCISRLWGWDDARQEERFRQKFDPAKHRVIRFEDEDIGRLDVEDCGDHVKLSYIALLPGFQHKGIGADLVRSVVALAHAQDLPVRLQTLRTNPAGPFYERLGFHVTDRDSERVYFEASPH